MKRLYLYLLGIGVFVVAAITGLNLALPGQILTLVLIQSALTSGALYSFSMLSKHDIKDKFSKILANLNSVQKRISNPTLIINSKGIIISANQSILELSEYTEAEIVGMNMAMLCGVEKDVKDLEQIDSCHLRTKSGEKVKLNTNFWPIEVDSTTVYLLLGRLPDQDHGLERSLSFYGIAAVEVDEAGKIFSAQGGTVTVLELDDLYDSPAELIDKSLFNICKFDELSLEEGSKEVEAITLKGTKKIFSTHVTKLKDRFSITFRDITRYKNTQKAIVESNRRYKTIVSVAPIGIMIVAKDKTIKEFNNYLASILGSQHPEGFIGKRAKDIPGLTEAGIVQGIGDVLRDGMPVTNQLNFLSQFGKTAKISFIITPIKDDEEITGAFVLVEDEGRNK